MSGKMEFHLIPIVMKFKYISDKEHFCIIIIRKKVKYMLGKMEFELIPYTYVGGSIICYTRWTFITFLC